MSSRPTETPSSVDRSSPSLLSLLTIPTYACASCFAIAVSFLVNADLPKGSAERWSSGSRSFTRKCPSVCVIYYRRFFSSSRPSVPDMAYIAPAGIAALSAKVANGCFCSIDLKKPGGAAVDACGAAVDACGAAVDACGAAVDACGAADAVLGGVGTGGVGTGPAVGAKSGAAALGGCVGMASSRCCNGAVVASEGIPLPRGSFILRALLCGRLGLSGLALGPGFLSR